ncbi:MAG: hypothetical protein AAGI23_04035 [Bacteroidota bacterium]
MSTPNQQLLQKYGYEVVALPRTSIEPLSLLAQNGSSLEMIDSPIQVLFEEDIKPIPTVERQAANIADKLVIAGDIGGNASVLSGIFSALKLSDSTLEAGLKGDWSKTANVVIDNVIERKVQLVALDGFLTGAIPVKDKFRTYEKMLKDSELYVITGTLSSDAFTIDLERGGGINGELKTKLEELVDVSGQVNRKKEGSYTLKSIDGEPLVFAYRAARIHYDETAWWEFWKEYEAGFRLVKAKGMVMRSLDEDVQSSEDANVDYLKTESGVSEI